MRWLHSQASLVSYHNHLSYLPVAGYIFQPESSIVKVCFTMAFFGSCFRITPVSKSNPGAFFGLICTLIVLSNSVGVTNGICCILRRLSSNCTPFGWMAEGMVKLSLLWKWYLTFGFHKMLKCLDYLSDCRCLKNVCTARSIIYHVTQLTYEAWFIW